MASEEARERFGEHFENAMESKATGRTIARFIGGAVIAISGVGVGLAAANSDKDPAVYIAGAGGLTAGTLIMTVGPRVIDRIYGGIQDMAIQGAFSEELDSDEEDDQ